MYGDREMLRKYFFHKKNLEIENLVPNVKIVFPI